MQSYLSITFINIDRCDPSRPFSQIGLQGSTTNRLEYRGISEELCAFRFQKNDDSLPHPTPRVDVVVPDDEVLLHHVSLDAFRVARASIESVLDFGLPVVMHYKSQAVEYSSQQLSTMRHSQTVGDTLATDLFAEAPHIPIFA